MANSVFISYARQDKEVVQRLAADLNERVDGGVWFDPGDIPHGDLWRQRMLDRIHGCRVCILVISPDAVAAPHVQEEVAEARAQGRKVMRVIHAPAQMPPEQEQSLQEGPCIDLQPGRYAENLPQLVDVLAAAGVARAAGRLPSLRELGEADRRAVRRRVPLWGLAWAIGWFVLGLLIALPSAGVLLGSLSGRPYAQEALAEGLYTVAAIPLALGLGGFVGGAVAGLITMLVLRRWAHRIGWKHMVPAMRTWLIGGPVQLAAAALAFFVLAAVAWATTPPDPGFLGGLRPLGAAVAAATVLVPVLAVALPFITGILAGRLTMRRIGKLEPEVPVRSTPGIVLAWGLATLAADGVAALAWFLSRLLLALLVPQLAAWGTQLTAPTPVDLRTRAQDGMVMVYVPAGEFQMGSADRDPGGAGDERPQHTVYLDAFWIDRTEVTVAQFGEFVQATGYKTTAEREGWADDYFEGSGGGPVRGANWQHPRGPGSNAEANHPVVQVSWDDAAAYCAWAGGALPTEAQWERAARGTQGLNYPWGNELECWRANLDDEVRLGSGFVIPGPGCDGYERTAPVGSFPAGASPLGALDMAGNVAEWTVDWYGPYSAGPQVNPSGPASGTYRVIRGSSWFGTDETDLRAAYRDLGIPDKRYPFFGFRCAVPEGGSPAATLAPPTATPRPAPVALRTRPQDGIAMVYIPAGEFPAGAADRNSIGAVHFVYLDAYWIDRTEVTNAQYGQCVEAGTCRPPHCWDKVALSGAQQPVVCVDWEQAQAYCRWAGGQLPTAAQWEKAARGTDMRAYPWGNTFDGSLLNYCDASCKGDMAYNDGYTYTAPVGSYPDGASPFGALDMAGNVAEWAADWLLSSYDPTYRNPSGPSSGTRRIFHGGSWHDGEYAAGVVNRMSAIPSDWSNDRGFRCVVLP